MLSELTKQQRKIVKLLAEGYDNYEIADELNIAYRTVKQHIYLLMKKLEARDRTEVVVWFYKEKIKQLEGKNASTTE